MSLIRTKACRQCHKEGSIEAQFDDVIDWQNGVLIQNALPYLHYTLREQLMTGIHPECWLLMFPVEEGK
jgi:hypothetical protein